MQNGALNGNGDTLRQHRGLLFNCELTDKIRYLHSETYCQTHKLLGNVRATQSRPKRSSAPPNGSPLASAAHSPRNGSKSLKA